MGPAVCFAPYERLEKERDEQIWQRLRATGQLWVEKMTIVTEWEHQWPFWIIGEITVWALFYAKELMKYATSCFIGLPSSVPFPLKLSYKMQFTWGWYTLFGLQATLMWCNPVTHYVLSFGWVKKKNPIKRECNFISAMMEVSNFPTFAIFTGMSFLNYLCCFDVPQLWIMWKIWIIPTRYFCV